MQAHDDLCRLACWGCGGLTAAAESGKAVLGPAPELPLAALCFDAIWLDLGPTLNWDTCNGTVLVVSLWPIESCS